MYGYILLPETILCGIFEGHFFPKVPLRELRLMTKNIRLIFYIKEL